ncbi:MAG: hypothetical protein K0R71_1682 [Bacillales bacterium]|jgi:hypothetical protein|nr:hypothetical protein [Bacillales bacterium]
MTITKKQFEELASDLCAIRHALDQTDGAQGNRSAVEYLHALNYMNDRFEEQNKRIIAQNDRIIELLEQLASNESEIIA